MSDTVWIVIGAVVIVLGVALIFGPRLLRLSLKTKVGTLTAEGAAPAAPVQTGVQIEDAEAVGNIEGFSDTGGGVKIQKAKAGGQVLGTHRRPGGAGGPKP